MTHDSNDAADADAIADADLVRMVERMAILGFRTGLDDLESALVDNLRGFIAGSTMAEGRDTSRYFTGNDLANVVRQARESICGLVDG
jgi:hypothetical protein